MCSVPGVSADPGPLGGGGADFPEGERQTPVAPCRGVQGCGLPQAKPLVLGSCLQEGEAEAPAQHPPQSTLHLGAALRFQVPRGWHPEPPERAAKGPPAREAEQEAQETRGEGLGPGREASRSWRASVCPLPLAVRGQASEGPAGPGRGDLDPSRWGGEVGPEPRGWWVPERTGGNPRGGGRQAGCSAGCSGVQQGRVAAGGRESGRTGAGVSQRIT